MICQKCHKKLATIFVTQTVEGETVRQFLCADCAKRLCNKGDFTLQNLLLNLFALTYHTGDKNAKDKKSNSFLTDEDQGPTEFDDLTCPLCGMTYKEFRESGQMGCAQCADVMKEQIQELLLSKGYALRYHGRVPKKLQHKVSSTQEIDALKKLLKEAVEKEDYQQAAYLRDKIHEIDKGDTHEMV